MVQGPEGLFFSHLRGPRRGRAAADLALLADAAEAGEAWAARDVSMPGVAGSLLQFCESAGGLGCALDIDALPVPPGVALDDWLLCFPSYAFLLVGDTDALAARFGAVGLTLARVGVLDDTGALRLLAGGRGELVWDLSRTSPACARVRGARAGALRAIAVISRHPAGIATGRLRPEGPGVARGREDGLGAGECDRHRLVGRPAEVPGLAQAAPPQPPEEGHVRRLDERDHPGTAGSPAVATAKRTSGAPTPRVRASASTAQAVALPEAGLVERVEPRPRPTTRSRSSRSP